MTRQCCDWQTILNGKNIQRVPLKIRKCVPAHEKVNTLCTQNETKLIFFNKSKKHYINNFKISLIVFNKGDGASLLS